MRDMPRVHDAAPQRLPSRTWLPCGWLILTLLVALPTLPGAQRQPPADLVVLSAKVLTVDPSSRIAAAVAVRGGVFVAVGRDADVEPLIGPRTRVIRAGGRTVVPGLIESHVHALGAAEGEAFQPYVALPDIPSLQAWVRARAAALPEGGWIWTPRTFPPRLRERRFPTRAELDAAAPKHPVVVDGAYALAVNTAALRAAGITPATPDPAGGVIVRDAAGEPTGLLRNVGGAAVPIRCASRKRRTAARLARPRARALCRGRDHQHRGARGIGGGLPRVRAAACAGAAAASGRGHAAGAIGRY